MPLRKGQPEKYENPFKVTTEGDIFEMRDKARKERALERQRQRKLKIWQKNPEPAYKLRVKSNIRTSKIGKPSVGGRRRPQEAMPDFVAKKREMFLMQMSLNTKKEEIKKMEDKAQMKDEALERSEKMLEEDATRFDDFLKKNDQEAHKAFKAADREIKDKQEKIAELKKLNIEMSKVDSQIGKLQDRLRECEKYKTFLMEVAKDGLSDAKNTKGAVETGEGETVEETLPFTDPKELLSVFAQKEEDNLFLIQILQRTEDDLDQLGRRYKNTKGNLAKQTDEITKNIKEMDGKIIFQRSKIDSLKSSKGVKTEEGKLSQSERMEFSLTKLASCIKKVYEDAFKELADQTDPLDQLSDIEVKVDSLIDTALKIPMVNRKLLEQKKENERRAHNRELKKAEMERANAERAEKAKARGQAQTHKRVGKALMPRRMLIKYKKKEEKKDDDDDEEKAEYIKYFTDSQMS